MKMFETGAMSAMTEYGRKGTGISKNRKDKKMSMFETGATGAMTEYGHKTLSVSIALAVVVLQYLPKTRRIRK